LHDERITTLDLTRDQFMRDVIDGRVEALKRLPPKYFYDAVGSRLFDRSPSSTSII